MSIESSKMRRDWVIKALSVGFAKSLGALHVTRTEAASKPTKENHEPRQHARPHSKPKPSPKINHQWHQKPSQQRRQAPQRDIRHIVLDVVVANVFEFKVAAVADHPADQGQEHFAKWRVNVEEVGSAEVVRGEFSKVDFIKAIALSAFVGFCEVGDAFEPKRRKVQ